MKLNNKGWGLQEMLIMSSILFITLLVVAYLIFVLYSNLDAKQANQYLKLETKLETAAVSYVASRLNFNEGIITLNTLKNTGYIDIFTDNNDNACSGYVVYKNHEYRPYISCEYYTTKNYNKSYE